MAGPSLWLTLRQHVRNWVSLSLSYRQPGQNITAALSEVIVHFAKEFYARQDIIADSIGAIRVQLRKANDKYNTFRPHHALKGMTPMEYITNNQADAV